MNDDDDEWQLSFHRNANTRDDKGRNEGPGGTRDVVLSPWYGIFFITIIPF